MQNHLLAALRNSKATARTLCRGLPMPLAMLAGTPAAAQVAPAQSSAPAVTAAAGLGVIPTISGHTAAAATLYDLNVQPVEQISPLIRRQYLNGVQSTIVKWTVKAGTVFPLHHHATEQITWIIQGRCEVFSQEKKYVLTASSVLIIPPNVPHEFQCTEDSIDVDFFAPGRQDWADGAPSVAAQAARPQQ